MLSLNKKNTNLFQELIYQGLRKLWNQFHRPFSPHFHGAENYKITLKIVLKIYFTQKWLYFVISHKLCEI